MRRFKLTIAYDGSQYHGWQVQKGQVTVQQRVEEAFQKLFPSVKRVHSSSRTDTGVHALGMVIHVDLPKTECQMDFYKLQMALNAFLPAMAVFFLSKFLACAAFSASVLAVMESVATSGAFGRMRRMCCSAPNAPP